MIRTKIKDFLHFMVKKTSLEIKENRQREVKDKRYRKEVQENKRFPLYSLIDSTTKWYIFIGGQH